MHEPLVIASAPRRHEAADRTAQHAAALVRRCAPQLPVSTEILSVPAGSALVSRSERALMLVVGAQTAWDARLIGPTTMEVARHAHCPVAVWRGTAGRPIPSRKPIAVGVDGTALSTTALDLGFELAAAFRVPLRAVHCWPPDRIEPVGRVGDRTDAERAVLAAALVPHRASHPEVDVADMAIPGVPGTVLAQLGRDAQLLVVGTRARDTATAALFGSTSRHLLHHAPCPVLLCR
ncbi:universal stress protein [Nocardia crassostreae]|uniref:universal stress protein n=1 Tax=Nocardia crassostreae TaxID=53428 RepID=UPI001FE14E95|nr:universal stress protein [Nocardia crassostreae]